MQASGVTWCALDAGELGHAGEEPGSRAAGVPLEHPPARQDELAHRLEGAPVPQRLAAVAKGVGGVGQRAVAYAQHVGAMLHRAAAALCQACRLAGGQREAAHAGAKGAGAARRHVRCPGAQRNTACVAAEL